MSWELRRPKQGGAQALGDLFTSQHVAGIFWMLS